MQIFSLEQIKHRLNLDHAIALQEEGFKLYSQGKVEVPPVGYLKVPHSPVRYHIKYGVIQGDNLFVVKLAGGLEYTTQEFGPSQLHGLILVLSALNGIPLYLLQDEGYLTALRTAIAGLICAKYLAPSTIDRIGVLGTGQQAELQVELLKKHTSCRQLCVWGRDRERALLYAQKMRKSGFDVEVLAAAAQVARSSQLLVTATASTEALFAAGDVHKGTHITALGADSPGKQELPIELVVQADRLIVDSKAQCLDHGELQKAYHQKLIPSSRVVELGEVIAHPAYRRASDSEITISDLTGVAVQDIQIAKAVL